MSGLGRATTERLLAAGANVVMIDLNEEAGAKAAEELGKRAHFVKADVQNEEQVQAARAQPHAQRRHHPSGRRHPHA
ncbi:SDR family NAD(P)-dependent oxidoreductase, partial [Brevibacterium paucivorans]|uniref:SDR family NAD(P)-dependent oxidoreductase n=1 Tax=Brevibacterium paucivorans TaxID=170994 RepID=UPI0035711F71